MLLGTRNNCWWVRGKDTNIYVANRNNMGKFNASGNTNLYQELPKALPNGAWSAPAYFNNTVYYAGVGDNLKAYTITNAQLSAMPASESATSFAYRGLLLASPPTERRMALCGRLRARRTRTACCTLTTPRTWAMNCTTATRRRMDGTLRRGQQVHHAGGFEWDGLRGDAELGSGVWLAALKLASVAGRESCFCPASCRVDLRVGLG